MKGRVDRTGEEGKERKWNEIEEKGRERRGMETDDKGTKDKKYNNMGKESKKPIEKRSKGKEKCVSEGMGSHEEERK